MRPSQSKTSRIGTRIKQRLAGRRLAGLLLVFVSTALCFQNCTGSNVQVRFKSSPHTQQSGNADPYTGKPDPGEYVRRVPNYGCEDSKHIYQSLTISGTAVTLQSVDPDSCAKTARELPIEDVFARTFNPDMVAYQGAAFEKNTEPNDSSFLGQWVETWCRTENLGASTADIVIREDIATGFLSSKIYSVQGTQQDIAVSKILGDGQIAYQAPDLSLTVDRAGKSGQLTVSRGSLNISAPTSCLTAGWLDPAQNAVPSFAINFSSPVLPRQVSFARATPATFIDANGILRTKATNEPRFEYNGAASGGLLLERAATNTMRFSEQLENSAAYITNDSSIQANVAVAPDGTQSADRLVENNGSVYPYIFQSGNGNYAASYTCSVYLKASGRSKAIIKIAGSTPANFCDGYADLASGNLAFSAQSAAGTAGNCQAFVRPVGNGWSRVAVSGVIDSAGGTGGIICQVIPYVTASTNVDLPYPGDGTSGLLIWGFQLEAGGAPTSYIATTNAAATRGADSAVVSAAGWFAPNGGSFWAVGEKYFARPNGTLPAEKIFALVSAAGEQASVSYINSGAFSATLQAGTIQWNSSANPITQNHHKFVLNYGGITTPNLMVDGTQAQASSGAGLVMNANSLQLGGSGNENWNGFIKAITYWPARLPDTEALRQSQ